MSIQAPNANLGSSKKKELQVNHIKKPDMSRHSPLLIGFSNRT